MFRCRDRERRDLTCSLFFPFILLYENTQLWLDILECKVTVNCVRSLQSIVKNDTSFKQRIK
ncbi:CLUMA_CG001040, isoform A [Clunio marinus]|uniref:CLUMA_CG001040, isoform A n=1 Tax=Clunio marinus TaxID=568069 RepID=A0A1J1HLB4_9DIPT|nr:CLUMA_CG001040, isoform A [Clunio marinus]